MKSLTILNAIALSSFGIASAASPNIVFVLTDDQDVHLNSLAYMPYVKKHLLEKGTHYERHYCTIALCCPSRVSLLTGRAAHNTNVTDVEPPYGGYPKFIDEGLNSAYLPIWLQEAGYNTYYTGKLMNSHTILNYFNEFAAGWTSNDFNLDPYTYNYLQSIWQRDHKIPEFAPRQYTTDVLKEKALGYIEDGAKSSSPFFLMVAPIAPHANVDVKFDLDPNSDHYTTTFSNPIPADRHKDLFNDVVVPRTPHFNPDEPSGVSWIAQLPKRNQTVVDYNDEFYRDRLRALQAVDEMVDGIFDRLETLGILNNTYVIYSADNGFHIGQHRLQPGKRCGFEEDINVPLIIRGPGVPENQTTDIVTTHTDLAPTFFDMLGISLRPEFDGMPIPYTDTSIQTAVSDRFEHVNVEHWGVGEAEGMYENGAGDKSTGQAQNTYKSVRLYSKYYNLYYSIWCNNEHELYDLTTDPYQMNNLMQNGNSSLSSYGSTIIINSHPISQIVPRLDALLMVLKTCKAKDCVDPWAVLHPAGNVKILEDALDSKYDSFYQESYQSNAVSFTKCEFGQILSSEGPLEPMVYSGSSQLALRD